MKSKKILACLLAGLMTLSLAACGGSGDQQSSEPAESSSAVAENTEPVESQPAESQPESTEQAAPETPEAAAASIDFEDGNMGFIGVYSQMADAADVELSVADFNGSKALQVKNLNGKVPYIAIDATSLLGADVAKVATMEMDMGISYDNGKFSAVSGSIFAWSGEERNETSDEWTVYIASKNPTTVTATLSEGEEFVADAGNIFIVNLKTDNGVSEGNGNATLYIDNIRFLDASGNLLTADTSVAFAAPEGFESTGKDMSNLAALTNVVVAEGFTASAGGWAQAGMDVSQEFLDALVPGSIIEVEYSSASGDMWILFNGAASGWARVGHNESGEGFDYVNNSHNVAQIPYEQLAAVYGDDVSTWGTSLQCEASDAWEVFSVKVGQRAPVYTLANAVEFPGFATSAGGWAQAGFEAPQEFLDALVPGSVIEVSYTSENDDMWILFNAASIGWRRCGQQNEWGEGTAVCYNGKAYITYEQLVATYGEDKSTWGTSLQCEASGAWEVYGVRVGTAVPMKMVNNLVNVEGFTASAGGWAQAGMDLPQEALDALVPGSVINVSYTSASGDMWVLFNGAASGWARVGHNESEEGFAACDGHTCQVTFEQLAAVYGDDVSTWGTSLQCEASDAWEVYAVSIGQSAPEAE